MASRVAQPSRIVVDKFGGSVLRRPEDIAAAVGVVAAQRSAGERPVVVVSAFEGVTDAILSSAAVLLPDGGAVLRRAAHDPDSPLARETDRALATGEALSAVIEQSDLYDVMARLPEGLQTMLGEGGGLVSGGEGQRVRLGRAMDRAGIRLAVLDEPYRGLDREKRRTLLARAREYWREATLICITHDVGETKAFDRVIVIENGRIVEDAAPASLMRRRKSRYHALLESEEQVRTGLWESADWRRLWVQDGKLSELTARELRAGEVSR